MDKDELSPINHDFLQGLSTYLTQNFGRGFSVGNLKNIRQFYRVYAQDRIGETVFSQSENYPATSKGFDR